MFDIGWGELLLIGAVALVVIGPKDLPRALRTLGQMTGKMRRMAAEFQSQFNEAIREAEMDEIRRSVTDVKDTAQSFNPIQTIRDEIKGAIDGPKAKPATETPGLSAQPTAAAPLEDSATPAPVPVPPPSSAPVSPPPSASTVAPVDIPPIAVPPVPDAAASVAATAAAVPPTAPPSPPPAQAAAAAAPARRRRATGETKATGEAETAAEPKVAPSGEGRPKPRRKPAAAANGAGEPAADPASAAKPRSRRPAAKPAPTDEGETP